MPGAYSCIVTTGKVYAQNVPVLEMKKQRRKDLPNVI